MEPIKQNTDSAVPPAKGIDTRQIAVSAEYQLVEKKQLKLRLAVKNGAPRDVFLLNRLWTLNQENKRRADSERVYRFVNKGTLRLLFGTCPLPRLTSVTYRNWPELTLLKSNKSFEAEYFIPLPVSEYSVYYSQTTKENAEEVAVGQVELILHVLAAGEAVKTKPSSVEDDAFELVSAASLDEIQLLRNEPKKLAMTAWRRTDEFSRVVLPGEKPEPLRQ